MLVNITNICYTYGVTGGSNTMKKPSMETNPATRLIGPVAVTALLSTTSAPAISQEFGGLTDDRTGGLEEIVVTALKREESLQDTPLSITALSSAEIERRRIDDITKLAVFAPNVDISSSPSGAGGGDNSQITIRGVGQNDFLLTTDPGVGVYLDGVYFARSTGGVLDVVGLDRVEILRGPQGTLFGRNTIGGAISLVSERPAETFGGFGEVTLGEFNRINLHAGVDLPLIDNRLLSKFVVLSKSADGYVDRLQTGEELGDEESITGRASLLWQAGDTLTVYATADYTRSRANSAASTSIGSFDPTAALVGLYNGFVAGPTMTPAFTDPSTGSLFSTNATGPNRSDSDVGGASVTVDWDISDSLAFKSITAYRDQEVKFGRDGDNSPLTIRETDNAGTQRQLSQEFQLLGASADGRFDWVLGSFFFDENADDFNEVRLVGGLFDGLEALPVPLPCLDPATAPPPCADPTSFYGIAPGGPGNLSNIALDLEFDAFLEVENRTYAVFAHGSYAFSDRWSGTFGIRYSDDKKDLTSFQRRINSGAIITDLSVSDSFDAVSPKAGLEFAASDSTLLYASYANGFKTGGFNGRPLNADELTSFEPEELDAFEVGIKTDLFDDRLRLNAAVFLNDYKDIQLTAAVDDGTGNLVVTVDNAAEAEIVGLELEVTARPTDRLDLFATLSVLDAEYKDIGGATQITEDSELVKAPEYTASLLARYTAPLGQWGDLVLQGDWSHIDDVFNDVQNNASIAQEAYSLVNSSITFVSADGRWRVSLFGSNLTDEEYIVNGVDAGVFGISEAVVGRLREWGVGFKASF